MPDLAHGPGHGLLSTARGRARWKYSAGRHRPARLSSRSATLARKLNAAAARRALAEARHAGGAAPFGARRGRHSPSAAGLRFALARSWSPWTRVPLPPRRWSGSVVAWSMSSARCWPGRRPPTTMASCSRLGGSRFLRLPCGLRIRWARTRSAASGLGIGRCCVIQRAAAKLILGLGDGSQHAALAFGRWMARRRRGETACVLLHWTRPVALATRCAAGRDPRRRWPAGRSPSPGTPPPNTVRPGHPHLRQCARGVAVRRPALTLPVLVDDVIRICSRADAAAAGRRHVARALRVG